MKREVFVKYAPSIEILQIKMMGYFHDHCYHLYYGLTEKVPEVYKKYITEDKKYVFIFEEDIPN